MDPEDHIEDWESGNDTDGDQVLQRVDLKILDTRGNEWNGSTQLAVYSDSSDYSIDGSDSSSLSD